MRRAAAAGLEITHRTSAAIGLPATATRHGYQVVRRGQPLHGVPAGVRQRGGRADGPYDAMVEVWNGVPWLTPVWTRKPRITFLHHVHGPMWDQLLPGPFAALGPGDGDAAGASAVPARLDGDAERGHPPGAARSRLPRRPGASR